VKDLIKLLIRLQEEDSRILEKRAFIDRVPRRIHEVDEPLKKATEELEKLKARGEMLVKKRRDREKALEELQDKIKKMKARVSEIKTNKEYQAHLREIEASEKEISKIEEEILVIMEELDVHQKQQRELEGKLSVEVEKLKAFRNELDLDVRKHEKELSELRERRAGIVKQIDPSVYDLYMALLKSGNGSAVTRTRNEVCMGCNMNIPPQLFVEIRKSEELIQCPQCRRILYYEEEQEPAPSS
jgi:uncharacterized protein